MHTWFNYPPYFMPQDRNSQKYTCKDQSLTCNLSLCSLRKYQQYFFFLNGKNQFKPTQCISYIRAEYTNYWRHPCGQIYPSLWTLSIFLWFGFFSFHTEISKQTKNAPVTFIFIWVTFIFRAQLKYSTINKI